ncbi:hypothetical protein AWW71_29270 [Bacillus cereus]|nr:hypothetical protein AWW71_29270 [Bacillus cereus]
MPDSAIPSPPLRSPATSAHETRALGLDVGESLGVAVVPVILGSSLVAARLSNQLFEAGFNVQPILHPAVPEKSARLRFFLSCEHTHAQMNAVLDTLVKQLSDIKAGA